METLLNMELWIKIFVEFTKIWQLYFVKDNLHMCQEIGLESMQQEFYLTDINELFDKCNISIVVQGDHV